ncbi:MAG TPA: gpW family head-tail joining protein [Nevskia sp.]|nr:gpW family head-tail joining protein [Nevskia sp.]
MFTRRTSILDGIDIATLQSRLAALQQAYLDLTSGGKAEVASYAQGDGSKSVTYTRANLGDLVQAILTLQTQIDRANGQCINRRAAISPQF